MERDAACGTLPEGPTQFGPAGSGRDRTANVINGTKRCRPKSARKQTAACNVFRDHGAFVRPTRPCPVQYFFHIRLDGQIIMDGEGSFHPDLATARSEARAAAREILANAIREGKGVSGNAILITDESGEDLTTVSIASLLLDALRQKLSVLD